MVDDPRDALELFGSAPVDALVLGPHLVHRGGCSDPGPPDDGRHRPAVRRRDPDRRPSQPARGCSAGWRRARGPAPADVVRGRRPARRRRAADPRADLGACLPARVLRGRPRSGRGPQRRLAAHDRALGGLPRRRRRAAERRGAADLVADLAACAGDVGGVAGPTARPAAAGPAAQPTGSGPRPACRRRAWATADMAYRREALVAVHGFDERFPRAYREDADLALRVRQAGWRLQVGARTTTHPVRPADDAGQRAGAARQRRRRPDAPAARSGLAAAGQKPVGVGSAGTSPPWPPRSRPSAGLRRVRRNRRQACEAARRGRRRDAGWA